MAKYNITDIQRDLEFYKSSKTGWQRAFDAIAKGGQSYEMRDGDTTRTLTRANLAEIRKTIIWLDSKISELELKLEEMDGSRPKRSRVAYFRGV